MKNRYRFISEVDIAPPPPLLPPIFGRKPRPTWLRLPRPQSLAITFWRIFELIIREIALRSVPSSPSRASRSWPPLALPKSLLSLGKACGGGSGLDPPLLASIF